MNSVWGYVALVGGAAIVLYYVFNMIVCCLVNKKFENYLVSELYTATEGAADPNNPDAVEDDEDAPPAGCCSGRDSMTRKRHHTPNNFHNEIFGQDEKILDRSRVGCSYRWCRYLKCCCGPRRRIEKVFMKARRMTAQELNITSLIKAQRQSAALCEIMNKEDKVINRHVRKVVTIDEEDEAGGQVDFQAGDDEDPKRMGDSTSKLDNSKTMVDPSPRDKLMGSGKERSDSMKKGRRRDDDEDQDEDDKGRRGGRSPGRRDDGDRKRRDRGDRGDRDDRRRKERGGDDEDDDRHKRREKRKRDDDDGDRDRDRDKDRRDRRRQGSKKRD